MKRALSIAITLAMLLSMLTVFFVSPVSAATVISNNTPAIRANVGETITLSNYSVTFDGDTSATTSGITWKNGSSTITTFKPTAKGVTTLTATAGSKTKNIYVVAKNSSDTEYVLYEANMADYTVAQLKTAGWTFTKSDSVSKASDGALLLSNTGKWASHIAYLPAWLGDLGNYKLAVNAKFTAFAESDTSRWFSLIVRGENRDGSTHYTHACFRGNNTASNGVEFGEWYNTGSGSNWNVTHKTAGTYSSLTDAYREFSLMAVGNGFREDIAGKQLLYIDEASYLSSSKKVVRKGNLGIQASGSTIAVKSVKVTLEDVIPEEILDTGLIYNKYHDAANLVNPIANVQKVSTVNADNLKNLSVAYIDLTTGVNAQTAFKACIDAKVVPTFYATTTAHADAITAASVALGSIDANVISNNKTVLNRIRTHSSAYVIRTGLVVDVSKEMADGTMTDYEADVIRRDVRAIPATFILIESKYATKQAVAELQEMALAVWVNVSSNAGTDAFNVEAMTALTSGANGIISASASGVSNLVNTHFQSQSFTRTPIIIGHRGNPSVAPENTIESFQAAYDNGGDVFELDVECTKDGVIVILHDGTLTRTTTYTGSTSIRNMTWAEAQKYYVLDLDGNSTGKPIPTLKEVLDWAKGKDIKLFIEFKDNSTTCVKGTMADVVERGMTQQVDIISFDKTALKLAREAVPGISTGYLNANDYTGSTYSLALKLFEARIEPAQREWSTVNCRSYSNEVTNLAVQAATDRGMTMWPWTYAYSNTSRAFFDCPDGITTDDTDAVKDMVKLVHAKDFAMMPGQTYNGGALTSETYGNALTAVPANSTIASVISGDSVKVENGKLVAVKNGVSTVVLAVKAWTYMGAEYIVYSQPVKVVVGDSDPAVLKPLVEMANSAKLGTLPEADLVELRKVCVKANKLINSTNPSETEVKAVASELNSYINKFAVASYTSPAPNYYKWDSATQSSSTELHETYIDDKIRLVDGKKSTPNGATTAYAAWQKTSDGKIEILLDFNNPAVRDTFKAYFASNSTWGVAAPANMEISYSTDGKAYTKINAGVTKKAVAEPTEADNLWSRWEYVVKSDEVITARYYKFTIYFEKNFIWIDEVETCNESTPWAAINNVNKPISEGDCNVYTSSFGDINTETANNSWAVNVIAKFDQTLGAYVVTSVSVGDGSDKTIKLASDEICISAHDWETATGGELPVPGSAYNTSVIKNAKVGEAIVFGGIDAENWEFGPAPSIKFVDKSELTDPVPPEEDSSDSSDDSSDDSSNDSSDDSSKEDDEPDPKPEQPDPEQPDPEQPAVDKGDINGNGEIDSMDYVLLKRAYFGTYKLSDIAIGDINDSGKIDSMDYVFLKRAYFGTYNIK